MCGRKKMKKKIAHNGIGLGDVFCLAETFKLPIMFVAKNIRQTRVMRMCRLI